jgi:YD repeat-containing protein
MNMRLRTILLALAAVLFFARSAPANVSLKNGNFLIAYTDVNYSGGFEPSVERVYNSKTPFKGIFGNGWGNKFEVYLSVSCGGILVVHEYGGGAENMFVPEGFNSQDLEDSYTALLDAAIQSGNLKGQGEAAKYRARIETDASFRYDEWEKYSGKKLVHAKTLPVGTIFRSDRFGYQYIKKTRDGYVRVMENGKFEFYNPEGHLARITDKNGNFIDLDYGENGQIKKITDNFGRTISISYNGQGLVGNLVDNRGREAKYEYNYKDDLVYSKDVDGNVYRYEYDKRYNMTTITYSDDTTLEVSYYSQERNEDVRSVKDRDGTITRYDYIKDPSDKMHLAIVVTVDTPSRPESSEPDIYNLDGEDLPPAQEGETPDINSETAPQDGGSGAGAEGVPPQAPPPVESKAEEAAPRDVLQEEKRVVVSKSRYEYFNRIDSKGAESTWKMITDIDGDKTETEYSEIGLPVAIDHNGEKVTFQYDGKGHVTRKETPSEVTELEYDYLVDKIKHVKKTPKGVAAEGVALNSDDPNKESMDQAPVEKPSESSFRYDDAGNLIYAENSEGVKITLLYDSVGRIDELKSDKSDIKFTYNVNSKPTVIELVGVGRINVSYTEGGDVEKVASDGGRKIALAVTGAFEELLDVIRPAGVSLSF